MVEEGEEEVFHRHILVLHMFCQLFRLVQHLVAVPGDIDLVGFPAGAGDLRELLDLRLCRLQKGGGVDLHLPQQLRDQAVFVGQQRIGQVEVFNLHIVILDRQVLGVLDRFQRLLG